MNRQRWLARLRDKRPLVASGFYAVGLGVVAGWLGDLPKGGALFDWLRVWFGTGVVVWNSAAFVVLALTTSLLAIALGSSLERINFRTVRAERLLVGHSRALVMTVSPPAREHLWFLDKATGAPVLAIGETVIRFERENFPGLKEAIAALDKSKTEFVVNWQQMLRVLAIQTEGESRLQHVVLMTTRGDNGSHAHREVAAALLRLYAPVDCTVTCIDADRDDGGINPLDLDETLRCLKRSYQDLHAKGIPDHDICVDVTGGNKTTSIAGALATVGTDVLFQYVETGPAKINRVFIYDLRADVSPAA